MKRAVFLSVGHNLETKWNLAKDRGAAAFGTTEFDECEKVANNVMECQRNAKASGANPSFEIVRVPVGLSIAARAKWVNANAVDGDVLVELHLNAAGPTATGVETFFYSGSNYAKEKAKAFQMEYTRVTGLAGRGVKGDMESRHGRLGIVRDTKPLAILVECGFITNVDDLATVRSRGANAIYSAIGKAFG